MSSTRFASTGTLRYSFNHSYGYKLIVEVDPEIVRYARSLVPRAWIINVPMYPAHISLVRKEVPVLTDLWGKHDGSVVQFYYESEVRFDEMYYWLRVYSETLAWIREELGLPRSRRGVTCPPDGEPVFHITVGNQK